MGDNSYMTSAAILSKTSDENLVKYTVHVDGVRIGWVLRFRDSKTWSAHLLDGPQAERVADFEISRTDAVEALVRWAERRLVIS